ncbi:MAG TPA: M48 family metallopeptidase [Candidatus Fimivivens sp.]|nr:M48 family metallopeptidase [Candidatus Fimivivens sp.]
MQNDKRTIEVDGRTLSYELRRHPRAKRISVSVRPGPDEGGRIVLTVPTRSSVRAGEAFLVRHAEWAVAQAGRLAGCEPLLASSSGHEYRKRRAEASAFVRSKVADWNRHYGFRHGRITIRNQSTRWGSCSAKGNLSFNWKLLLLPEHMADYVVVHELCHIAEFNHSARFWNLVAKTIPDCRRIARELRKG